MNQAIDPDPYRIEICERAPGGAAGRTLDTRFATSRSEAIQIGQEAIQQGNYVMVSSYSSMNSDYVIDPEIMETLLGRPLT